MALPKVLTATGLFKGIPHLVKPFLKPMLLISLGLHAAVLFIPLSSPLKKAENPKPKVIKLTKIPTIRIPPKPAAQPLNLNKPRTPNIPSQSSGKGIAIRQKQIQGTDQTIAQAKSETSKPSPASSNPPNSESGELKDLPQYEKNLQSCDGIAGCFQTGDPFGEVTKYLEKKLASKKIKFSIEKTSTDLFDSEYRAYKVVDNKNETQFLSILSNGENTKYVWAKEIVSGTSIMTRAETSTDVETFIGQLPNNFNDVSMSKLSPQRFSDADVNKFYVDPNPNNPVYKNTPAVSPIITSSSPNEAYQTLSKQLSSSKYNVNLIPAGYAGGTLCKITKPDQLKPLYVTIIATKQRDGSIVALWQNMPK
jgi:hypothetical protein